MRGPRDGHRNLVEPYLGRGRLLRTHPDSPHDSPAPPADRLAGDHSGLGVPPTKTVYDLAAHFPADYLAYDEASFHVHARDLHGTRVVLATHKSLDALVEIGGYPVVTRDELAHYVHATFDYYWHIFGGFPYTTATFVVHSLDDPREWHGASPVGSPVCHADALEPSESPPSPFTEEFYPEWFAHEMLHMWNGGVIRLASDPNGDLFSSEMWFVEGGTVYYSGRAAAEGLGRAAYHEILDGRYEDYVELRGGPSDLSFAELARRIGPAGPGGQEASVFSTMLYNKGALVANLLDVELAKRNHSLDEVMRRLYLAGLAGGNLTDAGIQRVVEEITGDDFEAFFEDYVRGRKPIDPVPDYVVRR